MSNSYLIFKNIHIIRPSVRYYYYILFNDYIFMIFIRHGFNYHNKIQFYKLRVSNYLNPSKIMFYHKLIIFFFHSGKIPTSIFIRLCLCKTLLYLKVYTINIYLYYNYIGTFFNNDNQDVQNTIFCKAQFLVFVVFNTL